MIRAVFSNFPGGIFALFVTAITGLAVGITPVEAKSVTVKAGKSTDIHHIAVYSPDSCASLLGRAWVERAPKHGRLTILRAQARLNGGPCKGRRVKVYIIRYRSSGRFRGTDSASVGFERPPMNYNPRQVTTKVSESFHITVK